jgi:hypothetical protein
MVSVHVLGNLEREKAKNNLKTTFRSVYVFSEKDAWGTADVC